MENKYIWEEEEEKLQKEAKTKRKKIKMEEIKQKEKQRRRKKKKKKKRLIKLTFIIVIIFILCFPFFKINNIQVKENIYFESSQIEEAVGFENRFSIVEYFYKRYLKVRKIEYLDNIKIKYDISSQNMLIYAKEFVPVYHDINSNNYYADENGNIKIWDIAYLTPLIINLSEGVEKEVAEQLKDLAYDVRLQIKLIEPADESKFGTDVLKISMYDGNTVYIYPYQIAYKMSYYNQMEQILKENNKKAGNIYLYIGDYYEPYS